VLRGVSVTVAISSYIDVVVTVEVQLVLVTVVVDSTGGSADVIKQLHAGVT
jgi:hypothetical protein